MTTDDASELFEDYQEGSHPHDSLAIKYQRAIFRALCDLIGLQTPRATEVVTKLPPPPENPAA